MTAHVTAVHHFTSMDFDNQQMPFLPIDYL